MNLAVNARDAMPGGGTLRSRPPTSVRAGAAPGRPARRLRRAHRRATPGAGWTRRPARHIFEPFFTTKEPGKGHRPRPLHGLRHRAAERRPDRGRERARARLHLPDPAPPARTARAPRPRRGARRRLRRGRRRDRPRRRGRARRPRARLRDARGAGYRILRRGERRGGAGPRGAPPGHDRPAPDRRRDARPLRPRPGGALRRRRPHARVLYMSGYAGDDLVRRGVAQESPHVLTKPFSAEALCARVRESLEG